MRAIVLTHAPAAGSDASLRPLTFRCPAAMTSVVGTPMLEIWVRKLARAGFDEIVFATGRFSDQIEAVFGDGRRFDVAIAHAFQGRVRAGVLEPFPASPAATVRRIHAQSGFCSQTTLLLEPSGLAEIDLGRMLDQHRESGVGLTSAVFDGSSLGPRVTLFEPEAASLIPEDVDPDSGALQTLGPSVDLRRRDFAAGAARPLASVADYIDLCAAALRGELADWTPPGREIAPGVRAGVHVSVDLARVRLRGPVYIEGGAVLRPDVEIVGPAWIGGGAVVDSGVRLAGSIVGPYTRLGGELSLDRRLVFGDQVVDGDGRVTLLEPLVPAWAPEERRRLQRDDPAGASMTLELRKLAGRVSGI